MAALKDEAFVLWVDADIIYIPPTMFPAMVESGKDIITPRYFLCRLIIFIYKRFIGAGMDH